MAAEAPDDMTMPLSPEAAGRARARWGEVFDLAASLSARADFHRDFVLWFQKERRADHARAFLLCDAADLAVQDAALRLMAAMGGTTRWERVLNEAQLAMGLPANSFDALKNGTINAERAGRQLAASAYLAALRSLDGYESATGDAPGGWLHARVNVLEGSVRKRLERAGVRLTAVQAGDYLRGRAEGAWFPVQKEIANAMGNVRVRRPGIYLVTEEQIHELRKKLQPGDVGITRKNWYLSNAGIPGFWPHAMLHVGTPEELDAFFDEAEVTKWCRSQPEGAASLTELLRKRHPDAWKAFTTARATTGEANTIIEAIAEGVTFNPATKAMHADSIAVLRPRVGKRDLAIAIVRAFANHGKPYDYNFDFLTDNALVCSEVVFKSYLPGEETAGLRLPLREVLDRPMVTPNEFVELYDKEFDSPSRVFDFVAFLEGQESKARSAWSDAAGLRSTWKRPKWEAVQ